VPASSVLPPVAPTPEPPAALLPVVHQVPSAPAAPKPDPAASDPPPLPKSIKQLPGGSDR